MALFVCSLFAQMATLGKSCITHSCHASLTLAMHHSLLPCITHSCHAVQVSLCKFPAHTSRIKCWLYPCMLRWLSASSNEVISLTKPQKERQKQRGSPLRATAATAVANSSPKRNKWQDMEVKRKQMC